MKILALAKGFLLIFAVTIVVSSIVSYLYSLIIHSEGTFDWGASIRLSIIFGIILSWLNYREKKNKKIE